MKKLSKKNNIIFKIFTICIILMQLILFLLIKATLGEILNFSIWNLFSKHKTLLIYLIIINLITFITFALDKFKAISNKWRIKVVTLLNLCFIGGSIGGLIAMYLFHHKTKQVCFTFGIPLIIITQIIILIYFTNII